MEEVKVVYALIRNHNNHVLMVLNHEGHWSLPGGKVEAHETLIEATIREVKEETGYNIEVGKLLAVNEAKLTLRNHHALFFTFEAQIINGEEEITLPDEIAQIEWAAIDIANLRMPYYIGGMNKLDHHHALYHYEGLV
ncbi:NUDIX hydrolase [Lysinibacillus sp. NPDC097195]|uniref:NUDIX hydrolase n=1 Tax=Lysinibacillus sp. NPDC097195 TaxID=3364141 RepID=UPI00380AFE56